MHKKAALEGLGLVRGGYQPRHLDKAQSHLSTGLRWSKCAYVTSALKAKYDKEEVTATTNTNKAKALAKSFFPNKPADAGIPMDVTYPKACLKPSQTTKEQIMHQIRKLKPYKAPRPDGIPNIVLIRCADILLGRLYFIYKANN